MPKKTEEAALELIENLKEEAWAEFEERMICALKTFVEGLLEEELMQRLGTEKIGLTDERERCRREHCKGG